ncbi:MAG: tRNA (N(6)-L-threonylcarbamoyladenosine(37)-C(2))-methylthiotransferase MtaB [Halanaerobiales bacterium]
MTKVAFHTLGCKVNQYETEAMIDQFKLKDYKIVNFRDKADIYIINSCTVTTQAASKSRKRARRAKRRNPEAKVVMVGCYPQAFPEEVLKIEEIDFIIGADGKKDIVNLIENKLKQYEKENIKNTEILKEISSYHDLTDYENLYVREVKETTRANIKIEDGCNQFCSYCIIPLARGPVRSRNKKSVLKEVKHLLNKDIREIILTGTHLGLYGSDRNANRALSNLIKDIIAIDKNFRIRLSSIEATEINEELLYLIKDHDKVCPHLHLPLQSGSEKILQYMNRPYTPQEFENIVEKIKNLIPEIAITTDVMVGFPGETDRDFNETLEFIKTINFSRLHVFPFSPREGTPAARMDNKISGNIKNERSQILRNLNKKLMKKYNKKFIGSKRNVIIEDSRDYKSGLLQGVTDNYIRVLLEAREVFKGKMKTVKLKQSNSHEYLRGKIIK